MKNLNFPNDWPKEIVEIIQNVGVATQENIDSVTLPQLQDTIKMKEKIQTIFSNMIPLLEEISLVENCEKYLDDERLKPIIHWIAEVLFIKKNDIAIMILGVVKTSDLLKMCQLLIHIIEKQKAIIDSQYLVKCSLNVQKQFFGKRQEVVNRHVDMVRCKIGMDEKTLVSVENFGFNLKVAEQNALFAIQKILSNRDYELENENSFESKKQLTFSIAEYLSAFDVTKKTTKRGKKEFSMQERENAILALKELAKIQAFILYQIPTGKNKKGEDCFDTYGGYDNIIKILAFYGNLTNSEMPDAIANDKMVRVKIELHPILFQRIDNYFCLKPSNYRSEIKKLLGKKNEATFNLFIEKLFEQVSIKTRAGQDMDQEMCFEIGMEELAIQLRMEKAIEQRKWKRIEEKIKSYVGYAKKLGYLTKALRGKTQKGGDKIIFYLNKEKFYQKEKDKKEESSQETFEEI